jgi:hypothetical protein
MRGGPVGSSLTDRSLVAARALGTSRRRAETDSVRLMNGDEDRPRLLWRDLAKREEAGLAYPGSRLVEEGGYSEGEGWFDPSVLTGAGAYRGYVVDAELSEVHEWFRSELAARGWGREVRPHRNPGDDSQSYVRGSEKIAVRVLGHSSEFPPGEHWLPPLKREEGLYYDVTLMLGLPPHAFTLPLD